MIDNDVILEVKGLTKEFPGVLALDHVDYDLKKGEIHAICGENGAGKSTFCNIITGIYHQDAGDVFLEGKKVAFNHPSEALKMGIRMVYQERNLIPYLTGAQNILLGEEPIKSKVFVDEKKITAIAKSIQKKYQLNTPLDVPVSYLSSAQRQSIEILRAFLYQPKILLLDEPTSSLTESEANSLFSVLKRIKEEGVAVVLITHKMEEVFLNADRITIFRNGQKIITKDKNEITENECIKYMVNRNINELYPKITPNSQDILLEINDLSDHVFLKNINFSIHKGEVLGFYGLIGSGRTETVEALYGLREMKTGTIHLDKKQLIPEVHRMMDHHIYIVPDDRKEKGLFNSFDIKGNLSVSFIDQFTRIFGLINKRKEKKIARKAADSDVLKIKYVSLDQQIDQLSGGNQQKVIISRWINQEKITALILDEPTIGIDVGTKYEIYKMIRQLAEERDVAIIFISSELPELTGVCDRIYVFKEGTINGEFMRDEFDSEKILEYAL